MQKLGMEEGVPIEHGMVTKAIERAQRLVEVFGLENADFAGIDPSELSRDEIRDTLWTRLRDRYTRKEAAVGHEVLALPGDVKAQLIGAERLPTLEHAPEADRAMLAGRAVIEPIERSIMLQIVDQQWKDHLYSLDHLREGIGLRGYGQRDPLVEYKKESFALFQAMRERVDEEILRYLWRLRPVLQGPEPPRHAPRRPAPVTTSEARPSVPAFAGAFGGGGGASAAPRPARVGGDDAAVKTVRRDEPKVGRNDPCPCGSGKKYKKCHGAQ
jgi:preprotein translocase subunit SecA